jgi:uncharacterized protein YlzI (FlbEa/FlbD family)
MKPPSAAFLLELEMSKFIKLTEFNGPEFIINVNCIQMVSNIGLIRLRILTPTGIEFIDVEGSFEEVKTKLCADEETIC